LQSRISVSYCSFKYESDGSAEIRGFEIEKIENRTTGRRINRKKL
jgi:hypothetical protein